jgi:hypothetical protein
MKRIGFLIALAASPCLAADPPQQRPLPSVDPIEQRALDQIAAPIRSRADLDDYLSHMPPRSPLFKLPEQARTEFIQSLVFTELGLASYRYLPLQQIDMADAYRILALFGVQSSLAVSSGIEAKTQDGQRVKVALSAR